MNPIRPNTTIGRSLALPTVAPPAVSTETGAAAAPPARAGDSASRSTDLRATLSRINASLTEVQGRDAKAQSADAALERVGGLIDDLRGLVSDTRRESGSGIDESRARIDEILNQIRSAAEVASRGPLRPTNPGQRLTNVAAGVLRPSAEARELAPGGSLDVDVEVLASAQQGGFYLSFGSDSLNLVDLERPFQIEVAGPLGTQMFYFPSGIAVSDIANIINAYSGKTGVVAKASAVASTGSFGVALKSRGFGDDSFVSVRSADDGGVTVTHPTAGIYQLRVNNTNEAIVPNSVDDIVLFSSVTTPILDYGQDVQARINGQDARTYGTVIKVSNPALRAAMELDTSRAQTLGTFTAFTIVASVAGGNAAEPGLPEDGALSELASFDAAKLLADAAGLPRGLARLLDDAAEDAGSWRGFIDTHRRVAILPELTRLNDEVAAAMLASASRGGRGPSEALTPERAAALLGSRRSAGA